MKYHEFKNVLEQFDIDSIAAIPVEQVFEWVKTGKLSKNEFKTWYDAVFLKTKNMFCSEDSE